MSAKTRPVRHAIPKPVYSFRRNTLPPLLGLFTFTITLVGLNFQWMFAQVQYRIAAQSSNAIVSIDTSVAASARPEEVPSVWIPSIDVHAPVIFESSTNEAQIQKSLRQGVVHYAMTAVPGEVGNVVLFGHSSGQPWAPGDYKFVFTLLNKLTKDDQIVVDFEGTRYVYSVRDSYVVEPYETKVLQPTTTRTLTLITCTPVGTSAKRLIVLADQVSPAPDDTAVATPPVAPSNPKKLPGNSPAFWESLKDIF